MANRYFLNIGANYNSTANWSATSGGTGGASVPTNVDDVFFDANSGNCTVNVASVAKSVNFTGYTNTITMTSTLTVSGSVTLVAAMTIAGASGLTINATGTFTSNGKTWPNALTFSATNTLTLADDLSIGGLLTINNATSTTVNGSFNINVNGGILLNGTMAKSTGTPIVNLLGGTWSGGGAFAIDVNINGNITLLSNVYFGNTASTPTLTYTSGTVTVTGSTLNIIANTGQSPTLNTGGMTWNNVSYGASNAGLTLLSNLNIGGTFTTTTLLLTINGTFSINCSGGLDANLAQGAGTTTLNLLGGTWSGGKTVRLNTNINGNITISGNVYYNTGTLTYTSGIVTVTGSTLNITGSTTLNISGMNWNNITFTGSLTITLTSDLTILGLFTLNGGNVVMTFNGTVNINLYGGFQNDSDTGVGTSQGLGTTTLNLYNGTWSGQGMTRLDMNIIGGNIVISTIRFTVRKLTYISGNVTALGNSWIGGTLDVAPIRWNDLFNTGGTLLSDLNVGGLLNSSAFSGAFNINCYGGLSITNFIQNSTVAVPVFNLYGGVFCPTLPLDGFYDCVFVIRGDITIGTPTLRSNCTLTYISGNVKNTSSSILRITNVGNVLINCDKVNFRDVLITAGRTVTMNRFFSGNPSVPLRVRSTGTNYTITFQDTTEKITKFTKISNCTVSRPGQLLCITDKSNKGGNLGVRYINQMPNGIAKNAPTSPNPMAYGLPSFLDSDPNFITG